MVVPTSEFNFSDEKKGLFAQIDISCIIFTHTQLLLPEIWSRSRIAQTNCLEKMLLRLDVPNKDGCRVDGSLHTSYRSH